MSIGILPFDWPFDWPFETCFEFFLELFIKSSGWKSLRHSRESGKLSSVSNFAIMFLCLVAGQVIRRRANFRVHDARALNIVVLWVSLPALILAELPRLFRDSQLSSDLLFVIGMPWAHFLVAAALMAYLGRSFGWSRRAIGALTLTAGLGNTSFIGLPVVESIYGTSGVRIALLLDQLGSFLVISTLGIVAASYYAGQSLTLSRVLRRILFFPPFQAFVIALIWGFSPLPIPTLAIETFGRIGATLVPLALLSVGWQLDLSKTALSRYRVPLTVGLSFKLLVWPLIVLIGLLPFLTVTSLPYQVTVLEAAMAPMITSAVVATEFDLEPELSQLMVGLGILVSALTLTLWTLTLKTVSV